MGVWEVMTIPAKKMGCTSSVHAIGKKKKKNIPEIAVFVPPLRVPVQSGIKETLQGLIPKDLADRIGSFRNQIVLVANAEGSAIRDLQKALEEYLPLLHGLTKKENELQELMEFKWKQLGDGRQDVCITNVWFELLSVFHMMSVLTLMEANLKLIPKQSSLSERLVSAECMRDAIDLLLKAAGYLNFCVQEVVLRRLPFEMKKKMPTDLQESVLEAILHQTLGQVTELQLGLAVQSKNATLSVKRRLACEQMSYFAKAHCYLSEVKNINAAGNKQSLFLKWKYLESKAAAYYYHGLIFDKGTQPSSHLSAMCCFLAAKELLAESKKACLTFCLADPVTRAPPPWGAMNHLHKIIPETAAKKSQMYGHLLDQEKNGLKILPDLPQFELSLEPDNYILPELDPAWNCGKWERHEQAVDQIPNDGTDGEPQA